MFRLAAYEFAVLTGEGSRNAVMTSSQTVLEASRAARLEGTVSIGAAYGPGRNAEADEDHGLWARADAAAEDARERSPACRDPR